MRRTGEKVGYAGLATCGSIWACPVCSARIQALRRLELGVLVASAVADGQTLAFGALTLRHRPGQPLNELWRALSYCHDRVNQDKAVRALRAEFERSGYVRAQEVTHGLMGWHPHSHPLVLFGRPVSQGQLDELAAAEHRAWASAAKRRGLGVPLIDAQSFKLVRDPAAALSDYLAKSVYSPAGVGWEMTGSQKKRGRRGSRTPWQILDGFRHTGDLGDLDLWHEFEAASKGKRALVWSRGLKKRYGIAELTDEAIAEAEEGTVDDTVLTVLDWSPIVAAPRLGADLLAAVQRGGFDAGADFCAAHGIDYMRGGVE